MVSWLLRGMIIVMSTVSPREGNKKLLIMFRVEPGCLGPHGKEHVDEFCHFAEQQFALAGMAMLGFSIIPRHDKKLPEVEYQLGGRKLSDAQANKYLSLFNMSLAQVMEQSSENLSTFIDQFCGRRH